MSKFKRSIHLVKLSDEKPLISDGLFFAKTGVYSMHTANSRHYWFMFFHLFGIRYTVEW